MSKTQDNLEKARALLDQSSQTLKRPKPKPEVNLNFRRAREVLTTNQQVTQQICTDMDSIIERLGAFAKVKTVKVAGREDVQQVELNLEELVSALTELSTLLHGTIDAVKSADSIGQAHHDVQNGAGTAAEICQDIAKTVQAYVNWKNTQPGD